MIGLGSKGHQLRLLVNIHLIKEFLMFAYSYYFFLQRNFEFLLMKEHGILFNQTKSLFKLLYSILLFSSGGNWKWETSFCSHNHRSLAINCPLFKVGPHTKSPWQPGARAFPPCSGFCQNSSIIALLFLAFTWYILLPAGGNHDKRAKV